MWQAQGLQRKVREFLRPYLLANLTTILFSNGGTGVRQGRSQCIPTLPLEKKSALPHHPSCCRSGVWETTTHGPDGTSPCILAIKCIWDISYGWSVAAFKPQCKSGVIVQDTTWTVTPNRKSLQKTVQGSLCQSLVSKVLGSCHFFEWNIAPSG